MVARVFDLQGKAEEAQAARDKMSELIGPTSVSAPLKILTSESRADIGPTSVSAPLNILTSE